MRSVRNEFRRVYWKILGGVALQDRTVGGVELGVWYDVYSRLLAEYPISDSSLI
jgi:hypothetical protein